MCYLLILSINFSLRSASQMESVGSSNVSDPNTFYDEEESQNRPEYGPNFVNFEPPRTGLDGVLALELFLRTFKEPIQMMVRSHKPTSIEQAARMAAFYARKNHSLFGKKNAGWLDD